MRRSARVAMSTSLYLFTLDCIQARVFQGMGSTVYRPIFRRLFNFFRVNAVDRGLCVKNNVCFARVFTTR